MFAHSIYSEDSHERAMCE